MSKKSVYVSVFLFIIFTVTCLLLFIFTAKDTSFSKELDEKVTQLINETTKDPQRQQAALLALEEMGEVAVPYIISHISDARTLAAREMRTENKFPGAMEHFAFHTPSRVHDALSILLVQITGKSYLFTDESTRNWQRKIIATQWIVWCVSNHSDKPSLCTKSLRNE